VVRHPRLEEMLRSYYGAQGLAVVERNLRMADVPEGSSLVESDQLTWPVLRARNVYILPGIPEIFRRKFLAIRERFREEPFHLRLVYSVSEEGVIAQHLDAVAAEFPDVALGSYPRWQPAEDGHRVKLTLEGKDRARVEQAAVTLTALLGPAHLTPEPR
jgi:molybdopterin-biosynthesis enzyme MoeA-like protein